MWMVNDEDLKLMVKVIEYANNKNYKMVRMIIFENNLFSKLDVDTYISACSGLRPLILRLEYCLNAQEYVNKSNIMLMFNLCAKLNLSHKEKIKLKQLIDNFDNHD